MLDENGGRNVAGKVVFVPKKMVLLKVLHDWLLRKNKCSGYMHDVLIFSYNATVTLTCTSAVFKM